MIILVVLAAIIGMSPLFIRKLKREARQNLWARQLRQALQNLVHALRVGVSFLQGLKYVSEESEEPLRGEWRHLIQSVEVGRSLSEALDELAQRVPINEMKWFVAAVQITQSTGGSLAEVLDTLATTLQEQQTLREKVSALTAQGKASGVLIGALPFLVMAALYLIAPEMIRPLFTTWLGQAMVAGIMIFVGIGGVIIKKIVTIRVD